jgi:hypothetical protein
LAGREGTAVFLNLFTPRKAVVDLVTGEVVWAVDAEPSLVRFAAQFPGQADANGDGALDVALGGRFGDLTVFDGVTGAVVRRSCLRGGEVVGLAEAASGANCQEGLTLSSVAVADVDGDGLEEWVVGGSDGWLYAVRASDGGRVWSLGLRYAVGDPAVADTDQDGRAEVLVATADSRLVLVDREALPPVAQAREVNLTGEDRILDPSVDIDISPRLDALGVAWEGQEGASSYVVTLLSENLNPVLEPVVVPGESHVFLGLSLLPGARYRASVTAVSEQGVSRPTISDGVLIVRDGPDIVGFQARPNPFDPVAGEVTRLTGIAASPAGLESVQLDLWSLDAPAPEALVRVDFDPQGAQRYDLDWSWDGRDEVGVLPEGLYHAQLTVYDLDGAPISDFVTLQLDVKPPPQVEPDPEPEDDLGPDPDANADAGDMDADLDADLDADVDASVDADEDAQELDAGGEPPEKEYIYVYRDEDDCCGCEGGREVGGKLGAGLLVLAVGAVLSRRSRARGSQA